MELDELPLRVQIQNMGHAFILDHTVNGKMDTNNGVDGNQITLGTASYGALTNDRVVNNQNTFREYYRDNTFFNEDNTSATFNPSTFDMDFTPGDVLESEVIFTDGPEEIVNGTFITTGGTASLTAGTALTYFLSADNKATWETATLGNTLSFTSTGTALAYKIESTGTATIGSRDSEGYDFPLKVKYTTGGTYTAPVLPYDVTYSFDSLIAAESGWDFVGTADEGYTTLQAKDTDGAWCWTDDGSISSNTGPPTGTACVYTETSSPVGTGDTFSMTLTSALDASTKDFFVTFDRCTQGTISAHLYFDAYNGSTWDSIDDWAGDAVTTFTSEGPYDFSAYTNVDFKIRFRTIVTGTTYENDMAVDTVRIYEV